MLHVSLDALSKIKPLVQNSTSSNNKVYEYTCFKYYI